MPRHSSKTTFHHLDLWIKRQGSSISYESWRGCPLATGPLACDQYSPKNKGRRKLEIFTLKKDSRFQIFQFENHFEKGGNLNHQFEKLKRKKNIQIPNPKAFGPLSGDILVT